MTDIRERFEAANLRASQRAGKWYWRLYVKVTGLPYAVCEIPRGIHEVTEEIHVSQGVLIRPMANFHQEHISDPARYISAGIFALGITLPCIATIGLIGYAIMRLITYL